jgi:hypothetical protein
MLLLLLMMMMMTMMTITMTVDDYGDYADDFLLLMLAVAVLTWEATKRTRKAERLYLTAAKAACACEMCHQQQNHTLDVYAWVSYGFGAAAGGLWVSPITTC